MKRSETLSSEKSSCRCPYCVQTQRFTSASYDDSDRPQDKPLNSYNLAEGLFKTAKEIPVWFKPTTA